LREEDDDSCAEMPPRGHHILPLDGRESGDILDVSKDGEYLAFRSKGRMWHGRSKVAICRIGDDGSIETVFRHKYPTLDCLEWSPNGRSLVIGSYRPGCIYLMEPMTGIVIKKKINLRCDGYGLNLTFSSDSRVLFCGRHYNRPITTHAIVDIPEYVAEEGSDEDVSDSSEEDDASNSDLSDWDDSD
jgi:hypothetical protein